MDATPQKTNTKERKARVLDAVWKYKDWPKERYYVLFEYRRHFFFDGVINREEACSSCAEIEIPKEVFNQRDSNYVIELFKNALKSLFDVVIMECSIRESK